MRKFDWKPKFDKRSLDYGIRTILPKGSVTQKRVVWKTGPVLDQGSEGACVGFGWMGEFLADPVPPSKPISSSQGNKLAFRYYKEAQKIDQWPGEEYSGTSVLAGAKTMQANGYISGYRWCFSLSELREAVISEGPVVIGVNWYSSMYSAPNGLVKISGEQVGGHCILVVGYDPKKLINGRKTEAFLWRNSWGESYGIKGSAWITARDLQKLISERAEMCVPIGRTDPSSPRSLSRQKTFNLLTLLGLLRSLFTR